VEASRPGQYIAVRSRNHRYDPLIVGFTSIPADLKTVTDPETDPAGRPALLAATPSAEWVVGWLRALALLAGATGLLTALFAFELFVRL